MRVEEEVLVGSTPVDAGMVVLSDPCYLPEDPLTAETLEEGEELGENYLAVTSGFGDGLGWQPWSCA